MTLSATSTSVTSSTGFISGGAAPSQDWMYASSDPSSRGKRMKRTRRFTASTETSALPRELPLDADVVAVPAAGATDHIADLVVNSLDSCGHVRVEAVVRSKLSIVAR